MTEEQLIHVRETILDSLEQFLIDNGLKEVLQVPHIRPSRSEARCLGSLSRCSDFSIEFSASGRSGREKPARIPR